MSYEVFKLKNCWLFDLDNTLYPPDSKIFDKIDLRMKKFISEKLKISREKAFEVQKNYYHKYGTTLFGLMKNYNIDPEDFLDFVHDIDMKSLKKDSSLKKDIKNLPGKKFIYTNGDEKYAKKILRCLGLSNVFDDIFDIKKANFIPKPKVESLKSLLKKYDLKPESIVYFEDLEKNLLTAYKIGITTVHIKNSNQNWNKKPFINYRFKTINGALDMIKKFLS
ncbi:MAG: pyrimidine 5'-nucleotidase [Rickettsiales bacterium]|nr:pyrimidine 5'-nucleotidase [Rickettsiales bacterium]